MNDGNRDLARDDVVQLLTEVGQVLAGQGLVATIYVVGGTAMSLTINSRRTTRDVDTDMRDHREELRAAAAEVAERHGLDPRWLNSAAAMFLSSEPDPDAGEMDLPGLRVLTSSPDHLLAMKMRAYRGRDMDDLEWLFNFLRIENPQQAADITNRLFDDTAVSWFDPDEALHVAEDVFRRAERLGRPIGTLRVPDDTYRNSLAVGGAWAQAARRHDHGPSTSQSDDIHRQGAANDPIQSPDP